jgi:predicted outer membrane protein
MIAAALAVGCLAPGASAQTTGQQRPAPQERPGAETERQQPAARGQQSDDQEFVRKAIEGNQKEIELGKFAATRASNAEVKAFANKMVEDHTKKLADLKSVAGAKMTSTAATPGATASAAGTSGTAAGTTGTSGTTATAGTSGTSATTGAAGTAGTTSGTGTTSATGTSGATASGERSGDPSGIPAKLANLQGAEFDRAYMEEMVDAHEDMVELLEDQSEDGDDAQLKKWAADALPGTREHLQLARSLRDKVKGS